MRLLLATLLTVAAAAGDTVILRNGSRHNGVFAEGNGRTIVIEDPTGLRRRFDVSEIASLEFDPEVDRAARWGKREKVESWRRVSPPPPPPRER
ncbi:MAG: hypothetical protein ACRD96_10810 [Bryobacteraceae bacterium]